LKLTVLGWLLSVPHLTAATSMMAGELRSLRIESCIFSTCLRGIERRVQVNDPSQTRFVVLNLSAEFPSGSARIHAPDFVLAYQRADGQDDRARCTAVGYASIEDPDPTRMGVGDYVSVQVGPETKRLAVAFAVERDVQRVALYVAGRAEPLRYVLGETRPYSVYISTNLKDANGLVQNVRKQVEDAGMRVTACGSGLTADESENTVHYQTGLESAARELSQRLMLQCGIVAKLKPMDVYTCNDLLVWLGARNLTGHPQAGATGAPPARALLSASATAPPAVPAE
jgi:hypothetical protein